MKKRESKQYGKKVLNQNKSNSSTFQVPSYTNLKDSLNEERAKTLEKLKAKIKQLQENIEKFDPLDLMNRAAYQLIPIWTSKLEESSNEYLVAPCAQYLQYLIARSPFESAKIELTDDIWTNIWESLIEIMHLMQKYYFTDGINRSSTGAIGSLKFMYEMKNLLWRGDNYSYFLEDYWVSHLSHLESKLIELFGINLVELVEGLKQIRDYHRTGLIDQYAKFNEMDEDFENLLVAKIETSGISLKEDGNINLDKWINNFIENNSELKQKRSEIQEQFIKTFTPQAFNITEISNLPKSLLSVIAIKPSESILTDLNYNRDDLSPASMSPLHQKPFLEVDGQYYSFFHSGFEDKIPNIIESEILRIRPGALEEIQSKRSQNIEKLSSELFNDILKPDRVFRNLHYYDLTGKLTELDLLIIVDDLLFIVETKSGAFTSNGSHLSLIKGYKKSIIEGHKQSLRVFNYIQSKDTSEFFDHTGKKVVFTLKRSDIRQVHRIVITKENLGWVGARVGVLQEIDPSIKTHVPWHISLEDLRIMRELFNENELQFVHYAEVREKAANESSIVQNDEIQHIGLYFSLNFYNQNQLKGRKPDFITYDDSFKKEIDQYFYDKAAGKKAILPGQKISEELKMLLVKLRDSKIKGRFEVASLILGMSSQGQENIKNGLSYLLEGAPQLKRRTMKVLSIESSVGVTITTAAGKQLDQELANSAAQSQQSNCSYWYVLQLSFDSNLDVLQLKRISPDEFSKEEINKGLKYIEDRVQRELVSKKVGRNNPCPCGSGKKYKKCHLV